MQTYPHERSPSRDQGPTNTIWPLMSTDGIDIDDVRSYMKERGLHWDMAEVNGWYPSRNAMDSFLRIVIPAVSTKDGHVYWQARAVSANVNVRYQTPKGPRHGALIYISADPLDSSPEQSGQVVIVEGPMDALAVAECGWDAIALMGITPGDKALDHLVKLVQKRPSLVVLDNEPSAQSAAGVIAMRLASAGNKAHVAKLRGAKDIAAMKHEDRGSWLESYLTVGDWRHSEP